MLGLGPCILGRAGPGVRKSLGRVLGWRGKLMITTLPCLAYRREHVFWHREGKTGHILLNRQTGRAVHNVVEISCCKLKVVPGWQHPAVAGHTILYHNFFSPNGRNRLVFLVRFSSGYTSILLKGWIKKSYYFFPHFLLFGLTRRLCFSQNESCKTVEDLSQHDKVLLNINDFFFFERVSTNLLQSKSLKT